MIKDHPDLQNEFLVFFNAEQAKKLGKESEHRIVLCAKHLYEVKTCNISGCLSILNISGYPPTLDISIFYFSFI